MLTGCPDLGSICRACWSLPHPSIGRRVRPAAQGRPQFQRLDARPRARTADHDHGLGVGKWSAPWREQLRAAYGQCEDYAGPTLGRNLRISPDDTHERDRCTCS